MRTVIWLIRAFFYLLGAIPDMKRAGRLREAGQMDEFYSVVDNRVRDFARQMLKNAGDMFGLCLIDENIEDFKDNRTHFCLFQLKEPVR